VTEESAAQRTTVVAFYSSADGAGRSCMVANIALMLASQGQRVLVVDLDLVSPSLHRYLSAFLPAEATDAGSDSLVSLSCAFDDADGAVDFIGPVTDEVADPERFTVTRPGLLQLGYDVVLIDTSAGAKAGVQAAELADVLVLGYTLNQQHRNKARLLAESIQRSPRGAEIRVLPVPMRVDQGTNRTTAQQRAAAHRQFAWLLGDLAEDERQRYRSEIEIPYEREYSANEGLPFLDSPSDDRDRLLGAYLRVARRLVPSLPESMSPAVSGQTLFRYRETQREMASQDSTVTILHAPADRLWAEWLVAELQLMDFPAVRRRIDQIQDGDSSPRSTLIVVSARLLSLPDLESLLGQVIGPIQSGAQPPVGVSIDGSWPPPGPFPTLTKVNLSGKDAKQAHVELASYYQISGPAAAARNPVHFPGRSTTLVFNLPAHTREAVGRDDLLDQIRDHFAGRTEPAPLTLTGPAGMGKTLIALEYAARFRTDYDTIVLIRVDSAETIRADLARLAAWMPPKRPGGEAGAAALEEQLWGSAAPKRWLLIGTGADDPALLAGLLPEAVQGHVLITGRDAVIAGSVPLTVPPLAPADAESIVASLVEGISREDAAQIAESMQGIPLALQLACAWLQVTLGQVSGLGALLATVTEDTAAQFRARFGELAEGGPAAVSDPVRPVVELQLGGLALSPLGEAATLLLETCAFLGSSGLSWRLLTSREMLAQLANRKMTDPILLPTVFHQIASRGLLLLDDTALLPGDLTQASLRVHPRVLHVVRDRMTPEQRADRRQQVSKMLAASAPVRVDDDVIRDRGAYAELLEHVGPSGAATQTDNAVRQWLVNQVRFLWQSDSRSSWEAAAALGESLAAYWRSALPGSPEDRLNDTLALRLQTQLANVYRSLGQFERARATDESALARDRSVLGLTHPRTLWTASSYAADLRLVGKFEEALLEDNATWQAVVQLMGRNHPLAISTSGNLALSELLAGEPEQALERRQDHDLPWCERFDRERPGETAWVQGHIGALQRELGRYQASLDSLRDARRGFERDHGSVPAPASLAELRVDGGIAIAKRRLGDPDLKANEGVLEDCRRLLGDAHPFAAATILSLAGDQHANRDSAAAVRQAAEALDRHLAIFGENHPFTRINQVDLSIYALAAGQFELADEASEAAFTGLRQSLDPLGHTHLWTAAAAVARSNVLAVTGRLEDAAPLEQWAQDEYKERLGADHDFTQVAVANARRSQRLRNEPRPAADRLEEAAQRRAIELDIPPY
jgi:tetratricopeptide (TPR) repeat protein